MTRNHGWSAITAVVLMSTGCLGPAFIKLSYEPGTYARKLTPVRVGVYYLDDERPGWPATAAMRMYDGAEGERASMHHADGDQTMSRFVAESLRAELAAAGLKVAASPLFDRPNAAFEAAAASAASVDRVLMGRISYFGLVSGVPGSKQPGVVGAAGAAGIVLAPLWAPMGALVADHVVGEWKEGTAYIDIDLWIVEPATGRTLWAGTAREKHIIKKLSGVVADRVAVLLPDVLHDDLIQLVSRPDFILAMGATLVPATPDAQSKAQAQSARELLRGGHAAEAAVEFRNAYKESGDPALIFNAGLCHRQAGDSKQAMEAFEEYRQKAPKSSQRRSLESRISDARRERRSNN